LGKKTKSQAASSIRRGLKQAIAHVKKTNGVRPRTPMLRRAWLSESAERKMKASRRMFLGSLRSRIKSLDPDLFDDGLQFRAAVLTMFDKAVQRYTGD